jgi:TatA/E family protein of Tat protein translocase
MGTLGVQEMVVIFLVALVLFGPKKLPELGRTIGKALTEFRRASSDLKSTFEREMQTLERENQSIKDITHQAASEIYERVENYTYDHDVPATVPPETNHPSTVGASEVAGAESHGTTLTAVADPPAETKAEGSAAVRIEDFWEPAPAAHSAVEGTVPRSEAPLAS